MPVLSQTLPQAVARALETNPGLEAQRASLTALGQRRVQATAQRRVQISGETTIGYSGSWSRARGLTSGVGNPIYSDTSPSSIGLVAAQPIWLAGRVEAALSQADAQIAAICLANNALIATRNVDDFVDCQIEIFNPWDL